VPSFTYSKDVIGAKFKNGSRDPNHAVIESQALDIFYLHTKLGDWRSSRSEDMNDMIAVVEIEKNRSRDTDHAPLGVVCHP